ncbi:PilX N-terminal domain-containing pilus assembly protein [Pseudomonas putida]|uniref:pilus assembly PilX family protein n=1 Tax=Pseudomonas putida TaxID=303 RepID=UPI00236381DE|nr:PilX N-terminal domain-containing pilus assembly protein [Pseudomonas putida]MDD2055158.1 PilX N-terminal domain-containing pilus assembly protein [Pseudomonas putida]
MSIAPAERGMTLLVSLVFLLLLTLLGISSMNNATLQEKMSTSVRLRNQSFQVAEAALRAGETAVQATGYTLAVCASPCAPPALSGQVAAAGADATGVVWVAANNGFYTVQNLGTTTDAVNVTPAGTSATLYRVTAAGIVGTSRSVVESIYAKY